MFKNCQEKIKKCQEILLKLEESQKESGLFIIHVNEFFGSSKTTLHFAYVCQSKQARLNLIASF